MHNHYDVCNYILNFNVTKLEKHFYIYTETFTKTQIFSPRDSEYCHTKNSSNALSAFITCRNVVMKQGVYFYI